MTDHDLQRYAGECALPVETVFFQKASVAEALASLRKKPIQQKIIYFYAVDDAYKLSGVVSTRQLLLADPNQKVEDIMQSAVVKMGVSQTLKEAMELFAVHPLLALPVVDKEDKLVGAIDVQMVMQEPLNVSDERSRYDVFQMIGITLEEKKHSSLFQGYLQRMPWLLCNVFSGLICAVISRFFEVVLAKVLILAFFIPLVLTLSESTSMQSVAQSLLLLHRPRFSWKAFKLRAIREWQVVVLIALSLGTIVGAFSLLWGDGFLPAVAIGVGIIAGVSTSAIFGIGVPVFLNRLHLDPKVASGPVVLMIVDMLTTAIYLGIATWWLL